MTEELSRGTLLALAIAQAAGKAGVPINRFALPLSPMPSAWLKQLSGAKNPKPATVERINMLIAGREVPPPPANNFQATPRRPAMQVVARSVPIPTVAPVDRDPCFRCGIRGDIGCGCAA